MSEVKVNKISPRSGTGVQLGDSGDTFTIPSGATINNQGTAVNFGATGSASWVTTVKTSTFTAVAGEGYFVNTTGGVVSVNLPAGTAGAVVAVKDYAGTFDTNKVTLVQNGSDKIGGSTDNSILSTEGIAVTLVFIDSTQGWLVTDSGLQSEAPGPEFIVATGGTITTVDTNFKVHTFTGPGTFTVCSVGNPAGSNEVSYMVAAAGGGGGGSERGFYSGGGGGAGGFREGKTPQCTYTASPIACTSGSNNGIPVTAQGYPIVAGGGGSGGTGTGPGQPNAARTNGGNGNVASALGITSTGGGGGGQSGGSVGGTGQGGANGGSGGGSGGFSCGGGGTGNTPSVSPAQGKDGGTGSVPGVGYGGSGGGATVAGVAGTGQNMVGGAGATTSINGSPTTFSVGANSGASACTAATAGANNSGIGGQGGNNYPSSANGGSGGSGIVVIRYKFQN